MTSAEYITPTAEDETPLQGVLYAEVENASDSTIYVTAEGRLASGTGQTQQTKEKSICPLVPGGNWELFFEAGGDASAQSIAEGDVVIAEAGAVDFPAPSGQVRVTGSNFTDQGMFEGAVENTDTESAQVTVLARALSESATTVGTRLVTTLGEVSSGEQAGFKFPAEQGRPNTLVPYSLLTYQIEPYTGNQNLSEFPGLSVE